MMIIIGAIIASILGILVIKPRLTKAAARGKRSARHPTVGAVDRK
ncbi:hypothetical protein [Rhizobium leguminosarum]|nr:hypothetical protein [Rhizobium leguminosarum]